MAAQKKQDVIVGDGAVYVLRTGMPVYIKTADVCAMTGKTNQWIGQLTGQGILNKHHTPHGSMYETAAAMKAYCAMLEERSAAVEKKSANSIEQERLIAEAGIKKSKAIISDLEAKELQGKMHRSEDVAAMTEDLIYAIRGMLVALPGRLAVDVADVGTPAEAAEVIRKEVYSIMKELANYRYDAQKYRERVRERRKWDAESRNDADGEQE